MDSPRLTMALQWARGLAALPRAVAFSVRVAWRVYHPAPRPLGQEPDARGLVFETWRWRTSKGAIPIEGWFVEGQGPNAVLVQHGVGRSRSETLRHVELLHSAGFHVLTVDMRNHGASGRCRSVTGMSSTYTSDLVDALTRLRADRRVTGGLGCLSMSFSTWPAVCAGASSRAEQVGLRVIVCDSGPVVDIRTAIARFATTLSARDRSLNGPVARHVITTLAPAVAAFILAVRRWPDAGCRLPVLLVAGDRDRILPAEEVLAMAPHLPAASTWVSPRAPHLGAIAVDPDGYREAVVGFLRSHLDDSRLSDVGAEVTP